ncbi:MAG: trypsin-like peptidase domain-containing protein [Dehalococcoidia bacterium]
MEGFEHYSPVPTQEHGRGNWALLTAVIAVLALVAGLIIGNNLPDSRRDFSPFPTSEKIEVFDETLVQELYDVSIPAVVKIETRQSSGGVFSFNERGQGSGFLVNDNGEFLTNFHVIDGAERVTVILESSKRLRGEVVGTDSSNDLALIRVDASQLQGIIPLTLGDSSQVRPGQLAIALGSPFGLQGSVTVGIVSGVGRSLPSVTQRRIVGMIQTDAAIFPGNSGGPLLNSSGEVIGINTAVASRGNESLGFAVPSNTAKNILARLASGVTIKRPWLGVSLLELDSERAEAAGLSVDRGIYIVDVVESSPAARAGLRPGSDGRGLPGPGGDVITAVDGIEVSTVDDLIAQFNTKQPGDTITLTLIRDGEEIEIETTLAEWPDSLS